MHRKAELQRFLLHTVVVAGKSAPFAKQAMDKFLGACGLTSHFDTSALPFDYIRELISKDFLPRMVVDAKMGNYRKITKAFTEIALSDLDLEKCWVDDLEKIHGIGCKTARFFLMYTRPVEDTNQIAVIDTQTWKWVTTDKWAAKRLKELGITKIPPKPVTISSRYKIYEQVVCEAAKKRGISSRDWDSSNWDDKSKFSDVARARIAATVENSR